MIAGYNIALTMGGKTLLGRTQDDLSISAIVKESITKDDAGVRQRAVTGHDVSFRVSALLEIGVGSAVNKMDRDDVIALALAKGSAAIVAVSYTCEKNKQRIINQGCPHENRSGSAFEGTSFFAVISARSK